MTIDFSSVIESMVQKAPSAWITSACNALRSFPATVTADYALKNIPVTNNADLAYLITAAVKHAAACMSWEALGWTIETTYALHHRWQSEQHVELLWSGPSPANTIPARRIDQALYDLITKAKREILLVTFAATKIERLTTELLKAVQRGVHIRLILEFEQSSEGQLSYDALKAFSPTLVSSVNVYHWPIEKRERNPAGRPGKLHAKVAIIDDTALVSSANLTDDAFNRNLELGVMINNPTFIQIFRDHINGLISSNIISEITNHHIECKK